MKYEEENNHWVTWEFLSNSAQQSSKKTKDQIISKNNTKRLTDIKIIPRFIYSYPSAASPVDTIASAAQKN